MSLHADVAVPARDRARLERLCRYVARPPIATERLSLLEDGRLLYRLKRRWRDGTTHLVFAPPSTLPPFLRPVGPSYVQSRGECGPEAPIRRLRRRIGVRL